MFDKVTTFSIDNKSYEIIDSDLIKTAAVKLPDGIEYDPDFLYMRVRAVSSGEWWGDNKNADFFPKKELLGGPTSGYKTFLTAHAFKNHENKDIANAIGDVLDATYDEEIEGVVLLIRIDKKIAPSIVRGFEKGFMTDVSMGCRIDYSICSICGNKAKTQKEYCDHVKFMRKKIMDDGRKVYEINIGPKFHDISTVLNGAEKVAKVTGIYISEGKIAYSQPKTLEKIASVLDEVDTQPAAYIQKPKHKIAEEQFDDFELQLSSPIKKTASTKQDYISKIAEIKKNIQAQITSIANKEVMQEFGNEQDGLRKVYKLLCEEYWNKNEYAAIADILRNIAKSRQISPNDVFEQFTDILDSVGIELTPVEFDNICNALTDIPLCEKQPLGLDSTDVVVNKLSDVLQNGASIGNVLKMFESGQLGDGNIQSKKPLSMMVIISKKSSQMPKCTENVQDDIFEALKPMIERRSCISPNVFGKITMACNSPREEICDHFAMPNISAPMSMSSMLMPLMYGIYQKNRVDNFMSPSWMDKFACYGADIASPNVVSQIEKTAGVMKNVGEAMKSDAKLGVKNILLGPKGQITYRKSLLFGAPITFGYSALQRSRIENGENVSSFNRYIAENPMNAYLIGSLAVPSAAKLVRESYKNIEPTLKQKTKDVADAMSKPMKSASLSDTILGNIEKCASENSEFILSDLFTKMRDKDDLLKQYSPEQIKALETMAILTADGNQPASDYFAKKFNLSDSDLNTYFISMKKQAKSDIKDEMTKVAGAAGAIVGDIAKGVASDMVMLPKKTSLIANIPGSLIDGAAFATIPLALTAFANRKNSKNNLKNISAKNTTQMQGVQPMIKAAASKFFR